MSIGTAEKGFKVRGQGHAMDQLTYNTGGMHFDGVAPRLTCLISVLFLIIFTSMACVM